MIGVVVGQRSECQHLAGMHVHDDPGGSLGVIGGNGAAKLLAQHILHAEIERDRHRLVAGHGQLRIVVDEFFDAGETLVVHVDQPDDVASGGADRIDAAKFLDEGEARKPELVNLGLLLRRQLAGDADETAALPEPGAEIPGIDVMKDAGDLLGELVDVDHLGRIGVKGRALDVGREQAPVAIENVGAMHGRGDVVETARTLSGIGKAERHEASADQHKGQGKG